VWAWPLPVIGLGGVCVLDIFLVYPVFGLLVRLVVDLGWGVERRLEVVEQRPSGLDVAVDAHLGDGGWDMMGCWGFRFRISDFKV